MPTDWMPILQTGGVTAVAIFAITILQRTWEGRLADQKTTQEELVQQRQTLMEMSKAAVAAMTEHSIVMKESIIASRELCQEVRASLVVTKRVRKET